MIDFKPSAVDLLGSFPPLCASMGRTERELAATILVRACQLRGNEWRGHSLPALGEVLGQDLDAGVEPIASMSRNPFCRPDLADLVAAGFAEWLGPPADDGAKELRELALTPAGLEALRRWTKKGPPPESP